MDPLRYELDDGIAVVTMDDGKANALSVAMLEALAGALTRAESEAKAMVLAGRAERFCAGFDLKVMMAGPASAREAARSRRGPTHASVRRPSCRS